MHIWVCILLPEMRVAAGFTALLQYASLKNAFCFCRHTGWGKWQFLFSFTVSVQQLQCKNYLTFYKLGPKKLFRAKRSFLGARRSGAPTVYPDTTIFSDLKQLLFFTGPNFCADFVFPILASIHYSGFRATCPAFWKEGLSSLSDKELNASKAHSREVACF